MLFWVRAVECHDPSEPLPGDHVGLLVYNARQISNVCASNIGDPRMPFPRECSSTGTTETSAEYQREGIIIHTDNTSVRLDMASRANLIEQIREQAPLVHHITNWVTIYACAAVTRAFGALPVMAHAEDEVEEMAALAQALVLNIGTLTPELVEAMIVAGRKANSLDIPIVLDVVGAGATGLRTDACRRILDSMDVAIIKGNAGEIGTLAGVAAEVKGVESISLAGDPAEAATQLAVETASVVVITGGEDIITDGKKLLLAKNGHPRMGEVVGTGCMAASVIGCFAAVERDHLMAAASALAAYGLAGEAATEAAAGPGSFLACLLDAVAALDELTVPERMHIEEISPEAK